jgi:hypothetical protein
MKSNILLPQDKLHRPPCCGSDGPEYSQYFLYATHHFIPSDYLFAPEPVGLSEMSEPTRKPTRCYNQEDNYLIYCLFIYGLFNEDVIFEIV